MPGVRRSEVMQDLARVLGHPLRQRLVFAFADEVTSPSRVAAELGEPLNLVSYHTRVLFEAGLLELVRTEPRRGAREHFYAAVAMAEIEDEAWGAVPLVQRRALVRRALEQFWRDATRALPRGGMDEAAAHVSRLRLTLDEQGKSDMAQLLRRTLEDVRRLEDESRARESPGARRWELVTLYFAPSGP
jgi:DNA-binding transcriptional ArsR family regulator